jgi:hypothetical protein
MANPIKYLKSGEKGTPTEEMGAGVCGIKEALLCRCLACYGGRHPVETLMCSTVVDNDFPGNVYASIWKQPRLVPTLLSNTAGLAELVFHRLQKVLWSEARLLHDDVRRGKGELVTYILYDPSRLSQIFGTQIWIRPQIFEVDS